MLYGVTMEEHGVSKIVSVKSTTREESAAASPHDAEDFANPSDLDRSQEPANA